MTTQTLQAAAIAACVQPAQDLAEASRRAWERWVAFPSYQRKSASAVQWERSMHDMAKRDAWLVTFARVEAQRWLTTEWDAERGVRLVVGEA